MGPASERLIVVGASAGGIGALQRLFRALRPDMQWPIAVVLHVGNADIGGLIDLFKRDSALPVQEAEAGASIEPARIDLAPGGYHVLVEHDRCFSLSLDERVCHSRPSVDVLFSSAADAYASHAIGIVLTGANHDGAAGLADIRERGGLGIVQRADDAEVPTMPQAALKLAGADAVLDVEQIAAFLQREFDRCR